jgi:hypothetical protein
LQKFPRHVSPDFRRAFEAEYLQVFSCAAGLALARVGVGMADFELPLPDRVIQRRGSGF